MRQRIWDKIEPHLAGCSTVMLIPDGTLNFIPWYALPGRKPGTCLIEDYTIGTVGCGQQLYGLLTEPASQARGLLLAGGVAYDEEPATGPEARGLLAAAGTRSPAMSQRAPWRPLPGTQQEIDAIAKDWKQSATPVLLSDRTASEASLRQHMPGCRYIHLATHGFFADERFRSALGHDVAGERLFGPAEDAPRRSRASASTRNPLVLSGVVLAGANRPPKTDSLDLPTGDDGILTAEEIVALDLRGTQLCVLSACDTGLGNVAGGEGVMGLARAFHAAGTRNVVASLWKVNDQATAALMKVFYTKLWKEGKPPIEALREAQLTIYRHPESIGKPELLDKLIATRAVDFGTPEELPDGGRTTPAGQTAPARLWAAFILSGDGH